MLMLQLSTVFIDRPVLSLRSGTQVGTTIAPIINPNNLKIEGVYCQVRGDKKQSILLSQDIRDLIPQGFVVNDQDALSAPDELVRLKSTMDIDFSLLGKQVVTSGGTKVGKVGDFATDIGSMFVIKIYVSQPLMKHLTSGSLVVDRTQIIEITDNNIVINDLQEKVPVAHAGALA
jgi:uncharacterized protein YrrD